MKKFENIYQDFIFINNIFQIYKPHQLMPKFPHISQMNLSLIYINVFFLSTVHISCNKMNLAGNFLKYLEPSEKFVYKFFSELLTFSYFSIILNKLILKIKKIFQKIITIISANLTSRGSEKDLKRDWKKLEGQGEVESRGDPACFTCNCM